MKNTVEFYKGRIATVRALISNNPDVDPMTRNISNFYVEDMRDSIDAIEALEEELKSFTEPFDATDGFMGVEDE